VFTKAETVSITASLKLVLNSICWFSLSNVLNYQLGYTNSVVGCRLWVVGCGL
jgi:hypothetical protein